MTGAATERRRPLSVVVTASQRPMNLEAVVKRVLEDLEVDDELMIADARTGGSEVLRIASAHGARYVWSPWTGAARARNAAWNVARHDLVAFLDDDLLIDRGWAHAMSGTLGSGVGIVHGPVGEGFRAGHTLVHEPPHAVNLAVDRTTLEALRGFDVRLGPGTQFPFGDDLDLLDRARRAGIRTSIAPLASARFLPWGDRLDLLPLDWRVGVGAGARIAKLVRTDPARARTVARDELWRRGLREMLVYGRRTWGGYASLRAGIRTVAGVVGVARALPIRVYGQHFAVPPLTEYGWPAPVLPE